MPASLPPHHPQQDLLANIRHSLDFVALNAYMSSATNQENPGGGDTAEACAALEWDPLYSILTGGTDQISGSGYLALLKIEERQGQMYETVTAPRAEGLDSDRFPDWAFPEFYEAVLTDLGGYHSETRNNDPWWEESVRQEYALAVYYSHHRDTVRAVLKLADWGIWGRWADLRARYGGGDGGAYTVVQRQYLRPILDLDLDRFEMDQKGADLFKAVSDWLSERRPRTVTTWRNVRGRYESCGAWVSGETLGANRERLVLHAREAWSDLRPSRPKGEGGNE